MIIKWLTGTPVSTPVSTFTNKYFEFLESPQISVFYSFITIKNCIFAVRKVIQLIIR